MRKFQDRGKNRSIISMTFLISFAIVMILIANLITQSVYAHANPISYSPKSNSIITEDENLPEKVVIIYSERPEPKASYTRVTNSENERVDKNDHKISANNPRESSVSIDASKLKPGIYTVSWLALSKDDGHITKGSYVFTVATVVNGSETGAISNNNFVDSVIIDNTNITYRISPFYSGINNNFTVSLSNPDGNSSANIKTVFLIFNNKQAGLGPISTELTKVDEGEYSGSGGYLSQPGKWEVKIVVQRTDAYDLNHSFTVDIKNPHTI
jgi:methionine-rich copper-binding protein CopC